MAQPRGTLQHDGTRVTCPKCDSVTVRPIVTTYDRRKWYVCQGNCGREFVDRENEGEV
jgi:transposase-like protein